MALRIKLLDSYPQARSRALLAADAVVADKALVGRAAGYVDNLSDGTTEKFHGINFNSGEVDNTDGDDGDQTITLITRGAARAPVTGITPANIGDEIYASDHETLTLTPTNNALVGTVVDVPENGVADFTFDLQAD